MVNIQTILAAGIEQDKPAKTNNIVSAVKRMEDSKNRWLTMRKQCCSRTASYPIGNPRLSLNNVYDTH
jgi:hypothetical protein